MARAGDEGAEVEGRAAGATLVAAAVTSVAWIAGPAMATSEDGRSGRDARYRERTCERAMDEGPTGELEKTTQPAPGSVVSPAETIEVRLRWDATKRDHDELHKAINCVIVDGVVDAGLSVEERPTANDGVFEAEFAVPDLPAGAELCTFGFLSDDAHGHGYARSEAACFTVEAGGDDTGEPESVPAPPAAVRPSPPPSSAAPPSAAPPSSAPAATPAETFAPAAAASPAPAAPVMGEVLDAAELPRTGPAQTGRLLAGAALALGGLVFVISPGRRR